MFKYGMKFSSIRYYQAQAMSLYRTNGIYAGRQFVEASRHDQMTARELGHAIIQFAFVASPEHLKASLMGSRGCRQL